MRWTVISARKYALESVDAVHGEDLTPEGDEISVHFSDDPRDVSDSCPWCVLGRCTRRISTFSEGGRVLVHGIRAS